MRHGQLAPLCVLLHGGDHPLILEARRLCRYGSMTRLEAV
jgi:hypothetical protein